MLNGTPRKTSAAALVELARQPPVGDVELEQRVARRKRHAVDLGDVPCADDQPARVRIGARSGPRPARSGRYACRRRRPAAPLASVYGAQIAVGVGPFVPNRHAVLAQVGDVRVAAQEPQQLVDDRPQVQPLGRQHGEALAQVEAHLVAERADRARAGPVVFHRTVRLDMSEQVEVCFHGCQILSG